MSTADTQSLTPIVRIGGSEIPEDWLHNLIEVRIERSLHMPSRATVRFLDPGYKLLSAMSYQLGTPLVVKAPKGGGLLITAELTGFSADQMGGDTPEFVLTADDRSHRLGRNTQTRAFSKSSYSEAVKKLAAGVGLVATVKDTGQKFDSFFQMGTDLEFLDEMARRTGYDWWVDERGELHFEPPSSSATVQVTLGGDLSAFSVSGLGLVPDEIVVTGWDRSAMKKVASTATPSSSELVAKGAIAKLLHKGKAFGGSKLVTGSLGAMSAAEAKTLGAALMRQAQYGAVRATGTCTGNANIKPGITVDVAAAGPLSGSYHVSGVEHIYRKGGLSTKFTAGDHIPTGLVDKLGGGGGGHSMGGVQLPALTVGVVTNNNDPEGMGRVKVKFPLSDVESDWCRTLILGGGPGRGSAWLPEVKDEVLVGFEGGDMRQTVVLGGLPSQSSKHATWEVKDGKASKRGFTTRTGHVLEFVEKGGMGTKGHILLGNADKKTKLRVGEDSLDIDVPMGNPLNIKVGSTTIGVDKQGSLNIESALHIKMVAKGNLTIEALAIEMKAQTTLKAKGGVGIELKGGAQAELSAGGMTAVKGAMVQIN